MKLSVMSLLFALALGLTSFSLLAADGDAPATPPADAPATPAADKPAENTPAAPVATSAPAAVVTDDSKVSKVDLIIRETKATEAQQAKIKEKVAAGEKAVAAWDVANAAKLQKLDAEISAAKTANNSADYQSFFQEKMSLKAGRDRLVQANAEDLLNLLTPEQRLAWEAYEIYQLMAVRFKVCGLTDEQLTKIRELCPATAKEEADVRDKDGNIATVRGKLIKNIHDNILTDDQRIKLDGKRLPVTPPPTPAPKADNKQPTDTTQPPKQPRRGGRGKPATGVPAF